MRQMKHQFRFNPLATAILTLLCGSSVSSYAESSAVNASSADQSASDSNTNNNQLKAAINESYPGEAFFSQYYVDKQSAEAQLRDQNLSDNRWCQGVWVTPFDSNDSSQTRANDEGSSVITPDHGYYNPKGDSTLSGNVIIDQQGRMVRADQVTIDQTQTHAKARGNVQMAQGGLIAQSDEIDYNLKEATGQLKNSFYISQS